MNEEGDDRRRGRLIDAGSELTGAVVGTVFGVITGNPVAGAAAGSLLGQSLRWAGGEFAQRVLSEREEVRIGAALQWAAERYEERRTAGEDVRDDGWFDKEPTGRSAAEELAEGVLIAAQREHEERKVQFIGYLLANLAFYHQIDRHHANRLLRLAQHLSWRQICLLALVRNRDRFNLTKETDYAPAKGQPIDWSIVGVRRELAELGYAQLEMVGASNDDSSHLGGTIGSPANLELWGDGQLLYLLMSLDKVSKEDLKEPAHLLRPLAADGREESGAAGEA